MKTRKTARQDMHNILNDRSCGARHHTDGLGKRRQGLFVGRVKPSSFLQSLLEFLEFHQELPYSFKLQRAYDQLIIASRRIDAHLSLSQDLVALFGKTL